MTEKRIPENWRDGETPWLQQPGEPSMWFQRFQAYLQLDPSKRSMERALRSMFPGLSETKVVGNATNWRKIGSAWAWRERALAYDAFVASSHGHQLAVIRTQLEQQRLESEQKGQDYIWRLIDGLMKRFEESAKYPLTSTRQVKYDEKGNIIGETNIAGVGQTLGPLVRSILDALAMAANGPVKKTASMRLEPPPSPEQSGSAEIVFAPASEQS